MQTAYRELRDKVDALFDKIYQKHRTEMKCATGCHSCCAPQLTVTRIEADVISLYLKEHPELVEKLRHLAHQNPHQNQRCSLLDAEGLCSIYEVRPIICRSHGAPILIQIDKKREGLDACELNFTQGMNMLEVGDWIHVETLNTMLTLIDWRYALDSDRSRPDPEDRIELTIEALSTLVDQL